MAVFNIRVKEIDDILNAIIQNLTPELFIDLNCGDIFKYFLPSNIENEYINITLDTIEERKYIFENVLNWCKDASNKTL